MFSWLKRKSDREERVQATLLYQTVEGALDGEDQAHVRIVGSVAALLLCVAYADKEYSGDEEGVLRATLERIQGLDARGVDCILGVLREHTVHIAAREATSYARELLMLTDEDFRLELLDVLVDVAAADGTVSVAETNLLRPVALALGLSAAHYNESQARHRDKLAVLRGS
jgi:uncharacterized tellurite resistance protein B-like protein